jgi:BirA family biotin operon repressor/biotin-[acetyl-CoA-carboxylase] ligase
VQETRRAVLDALADGPVSGPTLAERLDISRTAVWKHVEALRAVGFGVASGGEGYVLDGVPEYGGPAIEFGLDAPFVIEYHDSLPSTNARARELAAEGKGDVAVVADEQTGGRGRLDREWVSPPGSVLLSLVLRPDLPPAHVPLLTLSAAVATTRTAREAGVDARIKWPNDVLVVSGDGHDGSDGGDGHDGGDDGRDNGDGGVNGGDGDGEGTERKLAGILTEMEGEADRAAWVVVGIGVNVEPEGLPTGATGLREHAPDLDRRVFVQRLLETFDQLRAEPDAVLGAWREHAHTLGRQVRVETPRGTIVGEATDIAFPGTLVVETDDGPVEVHAGDCEHLRPA